MLASLVYVLGGGHGVSVGWIASRHVLVGGALGAWGLWAHVARREGSFRAGLWLAPLLLVAGLGSSEVALGALILLGFYEVFERREAPRQRLRALLPAALIGSSYLLAYGACGFGYELLTLDGTRSSPFEALYRKAPLRVGDRVQTRGLLAEVLATSAGAPTRVRLRFLGGDAQACLLRWRAGALRRLSLPPGASLSLPHEPGPMGF